MMRYFYKSLILDNFNTFCKEILKKFWFYFHFKFFFVEIPRYIFNDKNYCFFFKFYFLLKRYEIVSKG